jgi:hypothetical protein
MIYYDICGYDPDLRRQIYHFTQIYIYIYIDTLYRHLAAYNLLLDDKSITHRRDVLI